MIKKILELLLTPFAWLWHRHERAVLCDAGMEEGAIDPELVQERVADDLRHQILLETRKAILGRMDSAMPLNAHAEFPVLKELQRLSREIDDKRKDLPSKIVITKYTPPGTILKCRYEGDLYILISRPDWMQLESNLPKARPDNLPSSPFSLSGVPVIEDDELARTILIHVLGQRRKHLFN